ncbi:MAG TPA: TraB/GumN family protein [Steroidobacteraceae bacterium]|nr:TraB/GumN family protein [Steroidobacteraceae bacterium]
MRTATAAFMAASLLAGCFAAAACRADQPPALDEIVVTAERAGPGMWHVHRGAANVWILGSISPLPRDITWRSKQVESVLESTSQVLVQKPLEISIPRILWMLIADRKYLMVGKGKKLRDVLPPDLYRRFAAQRSNVGEDADKWERYRPIIAVAFLQRDAFHQVNLSMRLDLGAALRVLAKKHGVRVEEIKVAGVSDMLEALKTMPAATERTCVEASLTTIESGLPRLVDRAQAWAVGNVERIENLPELKDVDACRTALDAGKGALDVIGRIRQTWLENIEKYLRSAGTTIAVVNLDMLLERGGLLDELRAKGYEVDPP